MLRCRGKEEAGQGGSGAITPPPPLLFPSDRYLPDFQRRLSTGGGGGGGAGFGTYGGQALFVRNYYQRGGGFWRGPAKGPAYSNLISPQPKFLGQDFLGGVSEPKDPPPPSSYEQSLMAAPQQCIGGGPGCPTRERS